MNHLRDALKPIEREAFAHVCCPEGHVVGFGDPAESDEDILAHTHLDQCACPGQVFHVDDLFVQRGGGGTYLPMYASVHREDLEKLLDCWEAHNVP